VPLKEHPLVGDRWDCCKVHFDEDEDRWPRFRLVYRLLPDEIAAVEVEAIAVGRRAAMAPYVEAARRLGRLVDDQQSPFVTLTQVRCGPAPGHPGCGRPQPST
jgi:hypothetical protein